MFESHHNIIMRKTLLLAAVIVALVTLTQSQDIVPIESGSIVVEDQFLRRNTCITKTY